MQRFAHTSWPRRLSTWCKPTQRFTATEDEESSHACCHCANYTVQVCAVALFVCIPGVEFTQTTEGKESSRTFLL